MLQLLQVHLPATVADHLVAAFWSNPHVGVLLSEHLRNRTLDSSLVVSLSSEYGLTPNWYEPHEFSYFWRDALGWQSPHCEPEDKDLDATDFKLLASRRDAAARATANPFALKGFPLLWCATGFLEASPNSTVVVMRRDRESLQRSFLKGRIASEEWFSLKPIGWERYRNDPPADQVSFQVDALLAASDGLLALNDPRVVAVDLAALISNPADQVARIRHAVESNAKRR
jgi:hypothetical protein